MSRRTNHGDRSRTSRAEPAEECFFFVRLMRPIFQSVVVLVKARSDNDAARKARRLAPGLKPEEWKGEYDAISYAYDVQEVLNVDRIKQSSELSETTKELEKYLWERDDFRYLLLKADVTSGQGDVLIEPWLKRKSAVMRMDLVGDWAAGVEVLEERARKSFQRWVDERRRRPI